MSAIKPGSPTLAINSLNYHWGPLPASVCMCMYIYIYTQINGIS